MGIHSERAESARKSSAENQTGLHRAKEIGAVVVAAFVILGGFAYVVAETYDDVYRFIVEVGETIDSLS